MGLGKTLSILSLIASTRASAMKWSEKPVEVAPEEQVKPELAADGFRNRVFGMPEIEPANGNGKKRKAEACPRTTRIQRRGRGTLLMCPMSTLTNWTTQLKDHWGGQSVVVGGSEGIPVKDYYVSYARTRDDEAEFSVLRIYVYHGPQRIADVDFLAHFDIVLTSYNVLAMEYSKMCAGLTESGADTPNSDASSSVDPQELAAKLRRKKGKPARPETSALLAIDWFRVVLDEAQ
jgi:SNF2 family DNA or RNA helicase